MGLISRIAGLAVNGAHVLVVAAPGSEMLRMRAEAAVQVRGWRLALSPADADVLLVCGAPGDELERAFDQVWNQVPAPRARAAVDEPGRLLSALDGAAAELLDDVAQRRAAAHPVPLERRLEADHAGGSGHDHAAADAAGGDSSGDGGDSGMSGMDMGGMDMGGMDMSGPAGIPLAGGDEGDRDGLEMDVLHLPLGPVMPDWPSGLLVECTISGDVVMDATARMLPAAASGHDDAAPPAAQAAIRLDRAARILRLAGWATPAQRLDTIRNELLDGADAGHADRIGAVARRVSGSRVLGWSIAGVAGPGADVPGAVRTLLGDAIDALHGRPAGTLPDPDPGSVAAALTGRTLAGARLIVALHGARAAAREEQDA